MVPRAFIAGKNKRIEGMEFMLVEIVGKRYEERLITTSLKVAEHFEKEHRHVLDAIRNLAAENSAASFFTLTTYKNRGKEYPMYEMDRDGFVMRVMGYNGEKAMRFKEAYIVEFNAMDVKYSRIFGSIHRRAICSV